MASHIMRIIKRLDELIVNIIGTYIILTGFKSRKVSVHGIIINFDQR